MSRRYFSLEDAVNRLNRSERGQQAMADLLAFLDNGGISLDTANMQAVDTILWHAWNVCPATARDLMREQLGEEAAK